MSELKYSIFHNSKYGGSYLCGLETSCFGTRIIPYFDRLRSNALPLSYEQATRLQKRIQKGFSAVRLVVIDYPLKSLEEVSGDD